MNSADDPATVSQLVHLSQLGYHPDHTLTRVEAAMLIGRLHNQHGNLSSSGQMPATATANATDAHQLTVAVRQAKQASDAAYAEVRKDAEAALAAAVRERQEFWMNTCRDPMEMRTHSAQIWDLYRTYGCRFSVPNHEQTREILDALDTALPCWDTDHPELFYKTLELNFPELLRY